VRSFVELHGGTVAIDSVVGQGTTVTCSFPTHPSEP
jgi:signal transduction histidine kinase